MIGPTDRDRRIGSAGHLATRDVGGWADKGFARHNDRVVGGGVPRVAAKMRPSRHPSSPSHSRSSVYAFISSVTYTQARDHGVGAMLVVAGDLRCRAECTLRH